MMNATMRTDSSHELTEKDHRDFNRAEQLIFNTMSDQSWHSATELIEATGQREALRRMRNLRNHPLVSEIQKRRDGDSRDWLYKLVLT
jgi:hypothetical protein